jgi:hypothetical protein
MLPAFFALPPINACIMTIPMVKYQVRGMAMTKTVNKTLTCGHQVVANASSKAVYCTECQVRRRPISAKRLGSVTFEQPCEQCLAGNHCGGAVGSCGCDCE